MSHHPARNVNSIRSLSPSLAPVKVLSIPRNASLMPGIIIIFLFWFDYLTADLLGVLMCIEKVQINQPSLPIPLVEVIYGLTENLC